MNLYLHDLNIYICKSVEAVGGLDTPLLAAATVQVDDLLNNSRVREGSVQRHERRVRD